MDEKKLRDRRASYMRKWRKDNTEYAAKMQVYRRKWREENHEQHYEAQRVNKERVRQDILEFFGAKCVKCGFSDWRALKVDHVNGLGLADNRTKQNVHFFRKWLRNHEAEARSLYQLLCANCNWIKRHENQEFGYTRRAEIKDG